MGMGFSEGLVILMMFFGMGSYGPPLGVPPGPADTNIVNAAPADFLFYSTWRGVGEIKPDASPTDQWIAQEQVQTSVKKFKKAVLHWIEQMPPGFSSGMMDDLPKTLSSLTAAGFQNPGAVYLSDFEFEDGLGDPPVMTGAMILKLGDQTEKLQAAFKAEIDPFVSLNENLSQIELPQGKFYQFVEPEGKGPFRFGIHEGYFVAGWGNGALENLLSNMISPAPKWVAQVEAKLKVERICSVSQLNVKKCIEAFPEEAKSQPEFQPVLETTGLDNLETISWVAGIDSKGFVTRTDLAIDKYEGMLAIMDGDPIPKLYLEEIPIDATMTLGARIKSKALLDMLIKFSRSVGEEEQFEQMLSETDEFLGIDLRKSMEDSLDDFGYFYGNINMMSPTGGMMAAFRISNAMSFEDTYLKAVEKIEENLEESDLELTTKKSSDRTIYTVKDPNAFGLTTGVSWCLGPDHLYVSFEPGAISKHLRSRLAKKSFGTSARIDELYEFGESIGSGGPVFVASIDMNKILQNVFPLAGGFMDGDADFDKDFPFGWNDIPKLETLTNGLTPDIAGVFKTKTGFEVYQRQVIPGSSPGLTGGLVVAAALPASAEARIAAKRVASSNNIRQISLALLNFESAHMHFPASYSQDEDEKPLLSWRVHILPFIEEQELYNEFHLDEPWDSDHNKKLIEKMPDIYSHPKLKLAAGKTTYLGNGGADGIFVGPKEDGESNKGLGFRDITDGSSNTLLIVEVKGALAKTWTKPEDFDPAKHKDLAKALEGNWASGMFTIGMADGSVRTTTADEVSNEELKKMTTRAGGEIIDVDW